MKKKPGKELLKAMKKVSREQRLERDRAVGKPRAKSFGGKPSAREIRRNLKKSLRRLDSGEPLA